MRVGTATVEGGQAVIARRGDVRNHPTRATNHTRRGQPEPVEFSNNQAARSAPKAGHLNGGVRTVRVFWIIISVTGRNLQRIHWQHAGSRVSAEIGQEAVKRVWHRNSLSRFRRQTKLRLYGAEIRVSKSSTSPWGRPVRCTRIHARLARSSYQEPPWLPMAHLFCGKDGTMPSRYTPEIRAKAVQLVQEHRDEYDTEWAAMKAISARLGMNVETLRKWVRQDEVDSGQAPGCRPRESKELRELRKKNRRA